MFDFEPIEPFEPLRPVIADPKPAEVSHRKADALKVGLLLPLAAAGGFVLVMAMLAAALFVVLKASEGDRHQDHQHQEQFEQRDTTPIDNATLKGAYLVFVLENTAPTVAQLEAFDAFGAEKLESLGMAGFRRYDEEATEAKPYIAWGKGRNITTPAVFLVKSKEIVKAGPFANRNDVERFLK